MAISTGSGRARVNADINVTPMIDVMLVLLIIFMLVTPLIASGFQATMPTGRNPELKPEEDDEITLGIDVEGKFFIDGSPVQNEADVEGLLRQKYENRTKDKILFFKADRNLKYSVVQKGVEMARRAGARQLVAVTDKKGGFSGEEK